jgi:UDP-N-acetylmuramate--alanine ligase
MLQPLAVGSASLDALARGGPRAAYLAGAGGCGMRGLATFLLQAGWTVYGADRQPFGPGDPLLRLGLLGLGEDQAPPGPVSVAVRSAAVPETARGFVAARGAGGRPLLYSEMLGEVSQLRDTLAVAGSHGKTTCSAWIAHGLRLAGRDPGFLIGGGVPQLGASAHWGEAASPLVAESCEFDRSFHRLRPRWAALVNVTEEHPDTYPGGLPEVVEAFRHFLALLPEDGVVYAGPEAPDLSDATPARWVAAPPLPAAVEVGLPGHHNRRNAALVAAVLRGFGVEAGAVAEALLSFRGAARRMEEVGRCQGALLISDYAHHPLEVGATLQAIGERHPDRRRVVAFQPHQARRFTEYRDEFVSALDDADALVLLPVFRARDPEELRADVAEIVEPLLARRERPLTVVADTADAAAALRAWVRQDDVVVCLGAGNVDAFARGLAD